jgi:nicotinamidase-related amidase
MISCGSAILIVVDFQNNLFQVMHNKENLLVNAVKVIQGARIFNLPIILTEQSPAKMGQTMPAVARELNGVEAVGKENFSCWQVPEFREKLSTSNRREAIIMGIENHVCVYQTVLDLIDNGYSVQVVSDAVSSRTKENSDIALAAMKSAGAHLTSAEMVLFELVRSAGDARFKKI